MKGKITIVLFSLVLVFGILAASCDNTAYPKQDDEDPNTYIAYKSTGNDLPKTPLQRRLDVYEELQKKVVYRTSSDGTNWTAWSQPIAAFILGKVAMKAEYDDRAGDDSATLELKKGYRDLATRYKDLPILVDNPDIPVASTTPPILYVDIIR